MSLKDTRGFERGQAVKPGDSEKTSQAEKALDEQMRQRLLICEVAAAVTRSDTMQGMLQVCAEALVRYVDVALASIWTFNESENVLELIASAGLYTHIDRPHSRIRLGQFKVGKVAQERTPHFTNDVLTDLHVGDKEWAERENVVAFAGYPLVIEDRLLGVIGMFARQPLNATTVDAIGPVAHEIALGIEHKRANEALREREEHIRLLLDSAAEAIYGIDLEGRCTFANSACARLLGYGDSSQFLGRNMHDLVHHTRKDGNPYPEVECRVLQAFQRNQGSHVDDEVLWRADGSNFPAEYWSYPIRPGGKVAGAVVTFLDITERRRLEDQFRRAQQRLRHVVVSSPAVLFTLTIAQGRIEGISWISDNLWEILGHPPEAAIRPNWWRTNVHPDDLEGALARTSAELFNGGHSTQRWRFRHADGGYRWIRSELRLIRDEEGRPWEAVGAWSDNTDRKFAEEEQSRLRAQLQQAQKLESIGRLAGGIAHDFNNLLTVINGYSALALKELEPADPLHKMVAEIQKAGQRAADLARQLLLLSRKQVTQSAVVNLNEIIAEVEKMLGRLIGADIRLDSSLSGSLGCVVVDPGKIHQVLMNLAVNARDAMPGGGTLLIETRNVDSDDTGAEYHAEMKPGPYVQLKVSDTGIGMTRDEMSHLFEPFYSTKQPGEGTGLGLATVYSIVKQSGGSIWAYSEPGKGTTFTICLPRVDAAAGLEQEPRVEPEPSRGTETILVVDDQEQLLRMAGSVLRSFGYRVLEAVNPGEALLHCERYSGPIHLLLTDVVMPAITGPELAQRVMPLRPTMKVLFMSGYSERAIGDRRELPGACLSKPFSPEALANIVRGVLDANGSL